MKFAVHPYGSTMHPAADTPRCWTPGHSRLRRSSATFTPLAPADSTRWCRADVYQLGFGRFSSVTPALAVLAKTAEAAIAVRMRKMRRRTDIPAWRLVK